MVNQDRDRRKAGRATTWPPREAARADHPVRPGVGFWSALVSTILAWARAEAGPGRVLLWVPVAFGAGIALYFAAEREPVAMVTAFTAVFFCLVALLLRRHPIFPVAVMLAALAAGFATATLKTARMACWRGPCSASR